MHKLKQQLQQLAVIFLGLNLLSACTVQPARIPPGTIPVAAMATMLEDEHADEVFNGLSEDYVPDNSSARYYQLLDQFTRVAIAAGVNPDDWQIYLFDAPDVVDVRAIQGNTLFVWSGVFDVTRNHDEFAGLLACEISHGIARHTDAVEFNLGSELLFGVTDIAASVGIMVLSQGVVAVSGVGMTRWLYVEANDLDELDRIYDEQQVEEAAEIALLILANSNYSPGALLQFWRRAGTDAQLQERLERLNRSLTPGERVAVLEAAMALLPPEQSTTIGDDGLASLSTKHMSISGHTDQ